MPARICVCGYGLILGISYNYCIIYFFSKKSLSKDSRFVSAAERFQKRFQFLDRRIIKTCDCLSLLFNAIRSHSVYISQTNEVYKIQICLIEF